MAAKVMGVAQSTAAFLQSQAYDAIHLRDEGLQRLDDEDIIAIARAEGRVILTHDLDFDRIVALSRAHVPRAITVRLGDMRPVQVNRYLVKVLAQFADQLDQGALVSVNEHGIRVRALPITE